MSEELDVRPPTLSDVLAGDAEAILVDDRSGDRSSDPMQGAASGDNYFPVVHLSRNSGWPVPGLPPRGVPLPPRAAEVDRT
jgi:hypothetical protein